MSILRLLAFLSLSCAPPAFALPLLFDGLSAGQFGVVAVTSTANLNGTAAAADLATPEPGTQLLIGSLLLILAVVGRNLRRS
jgi:hypothetical protein